MGRNYYVITILDSVAMEGGENIYASDLDDLRRKLIAHDKRYGVSVKTAYGVYPSRNAYKDQFYHGFADPLNMPKKDPAIGYLERHKSKGLTYWTWETRTRNNLVNLNGTIKKK